jgi:ABC-type Co2+ transport system permease subunit
MPVPASLSLWAVHIADGVLTAPWLLGGFVVAGLLALGAVAVDAVRSLARGRSVQEEEVARVALLTAAFFVASLIHVRVGPTTVHLLLNGLLGVMLGWRAALAIPVGLCLQAGLFGHGGFTTLGVNSCIMTVPALLSWGLFAFLQRLPWVRLAWFRALLVAVSCLVGTMCLVYSGALLCTPSQPGTGTPDPTWANAVIVHPLTLAVVLAVLALAVCGERRLENAPEFPLGLLVGVFAVLATLALNSVVLLWGGQEDWPRLVLVSFVAHMPIVVIEGVVLGFTVGFLARVKPELLGWVSAPSLPQPGRCETLQGLERCPE